jgi:acylphosphatase
LNSHYDSYTVHIRIVARGQVQGVFYRETIRRAAEARGVSGSAVNLPDGTVELHLEGSDPDVTEVKTVAARGSEMSDVDSIEVESLEPTGITGFRVG